MTTTVNELLSLYVRKQLQDDSFTRWTRDELTEYINQGIKDMISRRPEAGVVTDVNLHLVAGARQTLSSDVVRLRAIYANTTRVVPTPTITGASISSTGGVMTLTFSTEIAP